MIDDASRIQYDGITDLPMSANQDSGGHYAVASKGDIGRQIGGRVNGVDQFEAHGGQAIGELSPNSVIADGDNDPGDPKRTCQLGEVIGMAQNLESVDAAPMSRPVRVDESDGIVGSRLADDIEYNSTVPAAADDDAWPNVIFGLNLGFRRNVVRLRHQKAHKKRR